MLVLLIVLLTCWICGGDECLPYTPVCGTDGITYSNLIEFQEVLETQYAKEINLELVGMGACTYKLHKTCGCCLEYSANVVCGSDDVTYRNLCHLKCTSRSNYGKLKKLELQYSGQCG